MLKRTLGVVIVCLASGAPCLADNLDAQIFPLTGEIRFRNSAASPVPFVFYSIESTSGALNSSPAVWKSITDVYDASGNGFIDSDPFANWTKIESIPAELTEGRFSPGTGSLPAFRSISLGNIWNPVLYPSHDLTFTVLQADMSPVAITVVPSVAGDYDGSGIVDGVDYNTWRQSFGSTTELDADGNLDGVVNAADYVVYRDHFGQSILGLGSGSNSGGGGGLSLGSAPVPEPGATVLFISAGMVALIARGRPRRAAPREVRRSAARR
jgi:hypothetical protein